MASDEALVAARRITIERVFDAPRALVFENWVDPQLLAEWFAPDGFAVIHCEVNPVPGGAWRVEFQSADGQVVSEVGEFLEIAPPERLQFTLTQSSSGKTGPNTTVVVQFVELDGRTRMLFEQSGFASAAVREGNAEGWAECFRKLEYRLLSR